MEAETKAEAIGERCEWSGFGCENAAEQEIRVGDEVRGNCTSVDGGE
jgi:hypothetical protein